MSEPTYRIELSHDPAEVDGLQWKATVHTAAEYDERFPLASCERFVHDSTRERAFDRAQEWCRAKSQEPQAPSTVFLSEDGEIIDPHDRPDLRSVS